MPNEIPVWFELAKALPSLTTAIAAIYGARIAKAGLDKWRIETIGKRKTELAEQALTAFYEARDVFVWVRTRGFFGGEGGPRQPADGESKTQQEKRNTYFIPIERLTHDKELFARLESLRYAFAAHFGEPTSEPFKAIRKVRTEISTSAHVLIQMTLDDDDNGRASQQRKESLINTIGWGTAARPDGIDDEIEEAVRDIEEVCSPILTVTK